MVRDDGVNKAPLVFIEHDFTEVRDKEEHEAFKEERRLYSRAYRARMNGEQKEKRRLYYQRYNRDRMARRDTQAKDKQADYLRRWHVQKMTREKKDIKNEREKLRKRKMRAENKASRGFLTFKHCQWKGTKDDKQFIFN